MDREAYLTGVRDALMEAARLTTENHRQSITYRECEILQLIDKFQSMENTTEKCTLMHSEVGGSNLNPYQVWIQQGDKILVGQGSDFHNALNHLEILLQGEDSPFEIVAK